MFLIENVSEEVSHSTFILFVDFKSQSDKEFLENHSVACNGAMMLR